jgi:uncharacterized protein YbjT (DUF2867 family)
MTTPRMTVLVVGATGSIGRLAVDEGIRQGHLVRALARDPDKASRLPREAQVVIGDVTRPETIAGAVDGVDAIVFTLGLDGLETSPKCVPHKARGEHEESAESGQAAGVLDK